MIMFYDIRHNFLIFRLGGHVIYHAWIQRGGGGGGGQGVQTRPPLENHKAIGFLINTGLDSMENH